jgi:hypothetical protein
MKAVTFHILLQRTCSEEVRIYEHISGWEEEEEEEEEERL